jgi:tetratricopeptide (TPR) repeat protein
VAALFVVILIGGLLIEMVNDPVEGYPALVSLQTEEPTAEPCDTSTDYMVEGETFITSGDYAAALTAYNCAIEVDPTNNAAYLLRGGLTGANGDYDQMGYDLYTFNTHNPAGVNTLLEVPVADVLPTLRTAIEARPDDAVLYLLRGLILNRVALGGGADFIRFNELAPDNAAGYLLHWPYPYSHTDENLLKAIEIDPDSMLLLSTLWGNLTQENVEFAKPFFDSVIQTEAAHLFAYNMRGQVDVILGDTVAATSDFYQHILNNQTDVTEIEDLTFGTALTSEVVVGGVYRLPFTAQAGQQLNIRVTRSDNISGLSPTVVALDPAGEVMPAPYTLGDNMALSPPIVGLEIPESGVYTLLVKANSVTPMTILVSEKAP